MSMSTRDDATGLEWAGALGAGGLFPTWRNCARPAYLRMLTEIPRFHRAARACWREPRRRHDPARVPRRPRLHRVLRPPLHGARCRGGLVLRPGGRAGLPGSLPVHVPRPPRHARRLRLAEWKTVIGGSRAYVDRLGALLDDVRLGTKVTSVLETAARRRGRRRQRPGRHVRRGRHRRPPRPGAVDARRADAAAARGAAALPYSANPALLHTDESLLPRARGTRVLELPPRRRRPRPRHRHLRPDPADAAADRDGYLVTLGGEGLVDPAKVIARREYAHPLYTPSSVAAQARLPECATDRVAFAGAYHGWGFHEDGARSGLAAGAIGVQLVEARPVRRRERERLTGS